METHKIFGLRFTFIYWWEFLSNYKDIFVLKSYFFKTKNKNPFIIDCGSHIGISVLYFKYLYPKAQVLAFEANPTIFTLLQKNIKQNKVKGVRLVHAAVGNMNGVVKFYTANKNVKHSLGDSMVKNFWYNPKNYDTVKVPSKKLSQYITRRVDLLNLDIEGAEGAVLKEIEHTLPYVHEIIMEYHGNDTHQRNNLKDILTILKRNGFIFSIREPATLLRPFRKQLITDKINDRQRRFLIIKAKKISEN